MIHCYNVVSIVARRKKKKKKKGDLIPNVLANLDVDILKNRIFVILVVSFSMLLPMSFLKGITRCAFAIDVCAPLLINIGMLYV
jgi:hypothetical protein